MFKVSQTPTVTESKKQSLDSDDEEDVKEETLFTPYKIDKKELKQIVLNADVNLEKDLEDVQEAVKMFMNSKVQKVFVGFILGY